MKLTKKQAKEHRQEWDTGCEEGRVIRFDDGQLFTLFPTVEAADLALAAALADGRQANRVSP